ncbi:MAG: tetratricopeptide repeat protein [Planctomycetes bacterium]|nr:tetratricopeptide repeat protein [Planctomycetota bacterium]
MMFPSRSSLVRCAIRQPIVFLRRWPKTGVVVCAITLGLVAVLSVFVWTRYHYRAALWCLHNDLLKDARRHLELSLQVWPHDLETNLLLARVCRMGGDYIQAERQLDECKRIGGMSDRIQLEWVLMKAQSGEILRWEPGLRRCLEEKHPDSVWILQTLAHRHLSDLRFMAALGYLDEWLKHDPDNLRALSWRGWVREKMENVEGAYDDAVRILQIAPDRWEIRLRLVEYLLGGRKVPEAEEHLEILRRDHADDTRVMHAWGQYQYHNGNLDEARQTFDALLQKAPDDAKALFERGQIEIQEGRLDTAEKFLRRSIETDPGNVDAQYALFFTLQNNPKRKGSAKQALSEYKTVQEAAKKIRQLLKDLDRMPGNTNIMVETGKVFLLHGNAKLGAQFLNRALNVNPYHKEGHELLIDYYEKTGDKKKADIHRKALVDLFPSPPVP